MKLRAYRVVEVLDRGDESCNHRHLHTEQEKGLLRSCRLCALREFVEPETSVMATPDIISRARKAGFFTNKPKGGI